MQRLLVIAAVLVAVTGCKKSKSEKCGQTWDRMMELGKEMAKALGGSDSDMPTDADKKDFMDKCMKLSGPAFDCFTDPDKMMDPACEDILEKEEASEPVEPVKLDWDTADAAEKHASAQVPRGWKHEEFAGDQWSPPEDGKNFSMSTYTIDSGCGGDCTAQPTAEWAKRADEEFADLKKADGATVVKDEKIGDTGRIAVVTSKEMGTMTTVLAVFWKDGGEEYITCKAELDRKLSANVDDFEKACRALKVTSFTAASDDLDVPGGDEDGGGSASGSGSGSASASGSGSGSAKPAPK